MNAYDMILNQQRAFNFKNFVHIGDATPVLSEVATNGIFSQCFQLGSSEAIDPNVRERMTVWNLSWDWDNHLDLALGRIADPSAVWINTLSVVRWLRRQVTDLVACDMEALVVYIDNASMLESSLELPCLAELTYIAEAASCYHEVVDDVLVVKRGLL